MKWIVVLALMLIPTVLHADTTMVPEALSYTQLPDPKQEAQAQALMQTIRCVVCQSQSIADSDADLAANMRALIRQRIAAGEKPEAIRAYLVARYGRWVSYRPTVDALTLPLWVAPLALIAIGALLARTNFRRRRRA
jgi:cytochrome c-type biogenesis protein CcmH